MADSIRTFVAIAIPELPELAAVRRSLSKMGWPVAVVRDENWHVTLKFLGDTPCSQLPTIQRILADLTLEFGRFTIQVERLGAFPTPERPSVIWAGMTNAEPLMSLVERLELTLEPLGFVREARPFQPHLTLARIKARPPQALFDLLSRHSETSFGDVEIRTVEFMQSDLQKSGARYSVISSHELRAES